MPPGLHRNHHIKAVTPGQITDRSRNNPQALRLINDSDAIDLLDDIGSMVKRISLSHRERLLLICDCLSQRFSTPFSPRRKSAKKQKKPQSARQHCELFRSLRRRDSVDAAAAEVLHGIAQLARTCRGVPDAIAVLQYGSLTESVRSSPKTESLWRVQRSARGRYDENLGQAFLDAVLPFLDSLPSAAVPERIVQ